MSLGVVFFRTEHRSDLECLKRTRELCLVLAVEAAQWKGQIIAEAGICECIQIARLECAFQLIAALLYLKNQLLVITALLAEQVLDVLDDRGLDLCKAELLIGSADFAQNILAKLHLSREDVLHTGDRFLL